MAINCSFFQEMRAVVMAFAPLLYFVGGGIKERENNISECKTHSVNNSSNEQTTTTNKQEC